MYYSESSDIKAVVWLTYRFLWVKGNFVDWASVARQLVQDPTWCGVPDIHKSRNTDEVNDFRCQTMQYRLCGVFISSYDAVGELRKSTERSKLYIDYDGSL